MPDVEDFTPGAAMAIAYLSVTRITGSGEPIEPLATLDKYNMKKEDEPSVKDNILNNTAFGLPHYKHRMDANALKDLSPGWKLHGLADVIFANAVPVGAPAAAARSFGRADSSRQDRPSASPPAAAALSSQLPTVAIGMAIGILIGLWLGSRR